MPGLKLPLLWCCAALCAGAVHSPAQSEPPEWRGLSDTRAVPTEESARHVLDSLATRLSFDVEVAGTERATTPSTLAPELAAQMRGFRDQALATLQAELDRTDPAKQPERFKTLTASVAQTRASYAQILGEAPAPATQADVGHPQSVWRIPAFGAGQPALPQALANLARVVSDNSPGEALDAFRASEDYQDPARCSGMAATAVLLGRDTAALAAWLRAHELAPNDPEPLMNLAGLALRIGLPRHALTLLQSAEIRLSDERAVAGLSARAVVLNARGHALILLKQFREAETVLRDALRLEPGLREARINLAHALYQQDDPDRKAEAVRWIRAAAHRLPPPVAGVTETSAETKEPAAGAPGPGDATDADRAASGRRAARDVFDLSRGKAGSLPTIAIPRTMADAHASWPAIRTLKAELSAEGASVTDRLLYLNARMRDQAKTSPAAKLAFDRAQDVFFYVSHAWAEREIMPLHTAWTRSTLDPGVGGQAGQYENPFGSRELQDELDHVAATTKGNYRAYCERSYSAIEPFHASWLGPIHTLETDANRYARAYYAHATAIAANLSDPVHHEYAMLLARSHMQTLAMSFVAPLEAVCRYQYYNVEAFGRLRGDGIASEKVAGSLPEPDWCPAGLRGDYSIGANLKLFSLALNCEKVGIEFSAGAWIKGFLAVDQMFDGSGSFFVGVAGDASVPVVGVLGIGATLKGGLYLTVDSRGSITDFGLKVSRTSTIGLGPLSYSQEIGNAFSLVTAVSN